MDSINFTAWVAQQRILQASDIVAADDLLIIGKKISKNRSGRGYEEFVISVADFFSSVGNGYTFVQDEGITLPQRTTMNFVGTGVTTSDIGGKTTITIAAGGHAIEDEGVALISRPIMNFVGAGVAVTDTGGKTLVTIAGAHIIEDEGVPLGTQRTSLNFTGNMVSVFDNAGKTEVNINLSIMRKVIYVDGINGNNALAAANLYDQKYAFLTYNAAHAAAAQNDTIILLPGSAYTWNGGQIFRNGGAIEIMKGATLTWIWTPGAITGNTGDSFTIYGEGTFSMNNTIDATDPAGNKTFNIFVDTFNITAGNGICFARGFMKFNIDVNVCNFNTVSAAGFFTAEAPILKFKCNKANWDTPSFPGFVFSALSASTDESTFDIEVMNITRGGLFQVQLGTSQNYKIRVKGKINSTSSAPAAVGVITTSQSPAGTINSEADIECTGSSFPYYITGGSRVSIQGTVKSNPPAQNQSAILVDNASAEVIVRNANVFGNRLAGGAIWAVRGLVMIEESTVTNEASVSGTSYAVQVGPNGISSAGLIKTLLKSVVLLSDPVTGNAGTAPTIYVDQPSGNQVIQYLGTVTANGIESANVTEELGFYTFWQGVTVSRIPKV